MERAERARNATNLPHGNVKQKDSEAQEQATEQVSH